MSKGLVVVTGASGFIAKHIVLQLLDEGYSVRATVRSPSREAELRAAMLGHVRDKTSVKTFYHLCISIWTTTKGGMRRYPVPTLSSTPRRHFRSFSQRTKTMSFGRRWTGHSVRFGLQSERMYPVS